MMMFPRFAALTVTSALALGAQAVRPGLFAAGAARGLPLRTSGYQVYMVGEMHGLANNAGFQTEYLRLVYAAGVRDVALEEDSVYEDDAEAFVDGRAATFSPQLCLRAPMLRAMREFNASRPEADRVRVHLTDVDSPALAIGQHLGLLKARLHADGVTIPADADIVRDGRSVVSRLTPLAATAAERGALRTVGFSIEVLRDGFEIDTGPSKGNPYDENREQAVATNIADIAATVPVLVLYGADHVSRTPRNDAGPHRDQPLNPVALRLEAAGLKVYTVITHPLDGESSWRGAKGELMWSAEDGHLSTGETMDHVLKSVPAARYIYVDPKTERTALPGDDIERMAPDAFVLFAHATAMPDACGPPVR